MNPSSPVIVSAVRTPIGSFQGTLSALAAPVLAAMTLKENLTRTRIDPVEVDDVILGMALQAGAGQAPARQAALLAGLPASVSAWTVNKVCSSGLRAVMSGAQAIFLGEAKMALAGGMESMSQVPYYLEDARRGYRMGHGELVDGMIQDGLWDPHKNCHMGGCAEQCARNYHIDRAAQDDFAVESYHRAQAAQRAGNFTAEIVPVTMQSRRGEVTVAEDEEPQMVDFLKLPLLSSAFEKDGTVTAANASKISDGAASVLLMSAEEAKRHGLSPLARIAGYSTHSQAPEEFTTAPAGAVEKLMKRIGWNRSDVDLWELNEAFSVVGLVNIKLLGLNPKQVNIFGGAVALGHPLGASGCRILVTLLSAMKHSGGKRGVAAICNGGGEATALAVEVL